MQISDPGELLTGEVHVWHGLITGEPSGEDVTVLSDTERARSARFVRPGDRARFVAAHAAQRRILARYLDADPAAIRFARSPCCRCGSTEHGRPSIEWPPTALSHNLSGSGQHWLLAVAAAGPVGVDIECHRGIEVDRMADACLTVSERQYLRDQPDELRQAAFFRCWTRKEAVLKACGVGLASNLGSLEVHPERCGAVEVRHTSGTCPDTWLVQDLAQGRRHVPTSGRRQGPTEAEQMRAHDITDTADWSGAVAQSAGPLVPVRFLAFPPS